MTLNKTFLLFILIANTAFADTTENSSPIDLRYDKCLDLSGGVTADMSDCTNEAIGEWDAELNKNYKLLMKQFNREQKKALKTAQRAWIKFRDSEMELVYATATGGSIDILNRGAIYLAMEKQRALDLQSYIEGN